MTDSASPLNYDAFDRQLDHFVRMMELLVDGWKDRNQQEMTFDIGSLCIKASKLCYMADQDLALQHTDATQGRKKENEQMLSQLEELMRCFAPFVMLMISTLNDTRMFLGKESPMFPFKVSVIFPRIFDLLKMEGMTIEKLNYLQGILVMAENMMGNEEPLLLAQLCDVPGAFPEQESSDDSGSPEVKQGIETMKRLWNVLCLLSLLSYLLLHFRRVCNVTSRPLDADAIIRLTEMKVQKYMSEKEGGRQLELYQSRLRYENDGKPLGVEQWLKARRELKALVPPKFELAFLHYADDTGKAGHELAKLTISQEEFESLVDVLAKYQLVTRRIFEISHPEEQAHTLPNEAFNWVVNGKSVDMLELKKSIGKMAALVKKKNQWFCVWSVLKHLNILRDDCIFATFAHQMMSREWFGGDKDIVPFTADNLSDFSHYFNEYDYTDWTEEMFQEKRELYGETKWGSKLCSNFSSLCDRMMKAIWGYQFLEAV